ncbi:Ser/Thr phosphatase family protein [Aedoeadaptatus nemausensis]|uniref:Ser/Thr phosphatase family protein n=1 Tax=Aedoeadaptatus nemausensis TaxID=2582829 RepID=A0A6V6XZ14_9FIRM|nr:Ser/Thr phosphatase family protein [Peptoniphilus nemausensis]
MRFLHTADLHLGRSFPFSRPPDREEGRKNRFSTFQRILEYGASQSVDYLFLVGDIFEQEKIRPEEVDYVLGLLRDQNFETLLLLGNHDFKLYDYISARLPQNVYLFEQGALSEYRDDKRGIIFYGTSWDRDSYHRILQCSGESFRDDYRHVLLHHGNWTGGDGYFPVDANILSFFDYIALGHVHKPILYENKLQMCGTPEPLDRTDRGKLGVVYGELTDVLSTKYIPLAQRILRHKTLDASSANIVEELKEGLQDDRAIYSFHLAGGYSGVLDKEIRRTLDLAGVAYEVEWARDLPKLIERVYRAHEKDALGEFIRRAAQLDEDEDTILAVCDMGIRSLLGEHYDS